MNTSFLNKTNIAIVLAVISIGFSAYNSYKQGKFETENEDRIWDTYWLAKTNESKIDGHEKEFIEHKGVLIARHEEALKDLKNNNKDIKNSESRLNEMADLMVLYSKQLKNHSELLKNHSDWLKVLTNKQDDFYEFVKAMAEDVDKLKKVHARKTGIKNSR